MSYVILYDWDERPESALSFAHHDAAAPRLLADDGSGEVVFGVLPDEDVASACIALGGSNPIDGDPAELGFAVAVCLDPARLAEYRREFQVFRERKADRL